MSGDGSGDAAVPAAGVINQTTPLEVVAQQESTRSYFLAQTLESTKTVPIVSANLPLDKGTTDEVAEPETPAEGDGSSEDEGGDDSDESDPGASDDAAVTPGVSAESTVVGSFEYRGITYAVEPGGESVAVVATDYAKLPEEFIEAQTIVLPSMVTSDGLDFYTVSRIADHAFASINGSVAVAAQEGQDGATPEPSENDEATNDAAAEPSEDGEVADDVVSEPTDGDDGVGDKADDAADDATIGITAVTIPASIVEIGDDAFTGCDTLQYVIVSDDNPKYSMYDGCLYDADQTSLLLIPEGRLGAVRIAPSAMTIPEDVSSHCAHLASFVVDPDSAASQLLVENDFYNANDEKIEVTIRSRGESLEDVIDYGFYERIAKREEASSAEALTDVINGENTGESLDDAFSERQASAADVETVDEKVAGIRGAVSTWRDFTTKYGYATAYDYRVNPPSGWVQFSSTTIREQSPWFSIYYPYGRLGSGQVSGYRGISIGTTPPWKGSYYALGTSTLANVPFYSYTVGWTETDRKYAEYHPSYGMQIYMYRSSDRQHFSHPVVDDSTRKVIDCRLFAMNPSGTLSVLAFPGPYTIGISYFGDYIDVANDNTSVTGTWQSRAEHGAKEVHIEHWNTGVADPSSTAYDITSYMPIPDQSSITPGYVFVGWNIDPSATAKTETGWYYRVGASADLKTVTTSTDLYAIYQKGYPVTWDTERFGGSEARIDRFAENAEWSSSANIHTPDPNPDANVNHAEVSVVEDITDTEEDVLTCTATSRFPQVANKDGISFLGWTDDPSGAPPSWREGGSYFDWDDGVVKLSLNDPSSGFKIVKETAKDKRESELSASDVLESYDIERFRNATWYAVFATDVTFEAASYGGSIRGEGNSDVAIAVLNNRPIAPATILVDGKVPEDETSMTGKVPSAIVVDGAAQPGDFVPNQYGRENYDGSRWSFKGWTVKPNPNVSDSGEVGGSTDHLADADVIGSDALVPDGATTYHAVWECGVSWVKDAGSAPEVTAVYDVAYPSGESAATVKWYLYGYELATPGLTKDASGNVAPASHSFSHWEDGIDGAAAPEGAADATYTVLTGGPVTAYWAPNERAVVLNGQGSDEAPCADKDTYAVYGQAMQLHPATTDGTSWNAGVALTAPVREGYTFAGYWNTRFTEDPSRTEADVPRTDGTTIASVVPKCYFAADENGGIELVDGLTWDIIDTAQQLFAHWRYTVVLDANVYNSDGEIVLADDGSYAADPEWRALATEQSATSDTVVRRTAAVEGSGSSVAVRNAVAVESFTAIDGAPIQLPQLANRRGYDPTWSWKRIGTADAPFALDSAGKMTASTFRPVVGTETLADGTTMAALVLVADWSGKAKTYDVRLCSTYETTSDAFAVANSALAEQTVQVVYDSPIDVSKITAYANGDAPNYVDATKDVSGASRNLVLKGFYRDACAVDGAGSGNRVYVSVVDDAFVSEGLAFREIYPEGANEVKLYAFWTYNTTDIVFDLQGGTIEGQNAAQLGDALIIKGVTSHDATPVLTGKLATAPERAGYEFAGWWNTPYREGVRFQDENGVEIAPKRYYGDGTATNVDVNIPTWEEFGTTTLYAHWKYDIEFNTNVDPVTDLASVSLSAMKTTNDDARTNVTVPLARAGASTDDFGNVYTEGAGSVSGYGNSDYETLTVRAIAGAPVQLPSAQLRRERGTSTYERIGYDATWKWAHDAAGASGVMNPDEAADRFTSESDAWTEGAASIPCKVGGNTNQKTLELFAQWKGYEKEYGVQVNYAYTDGATTYEAKGGHVDALAFKVTYDHDDYTVLGDTVKFGHPLPAEDSTSAHAKAFVDGETYDDLDFAGITTAKNDFSASSGNAAYPTLGTRYWDAAGDSLVKRFRAITGADVDVYNTTDALFPMYVAWAQPTREVTFNLFDEPNAGDSTEVTDLSVDGLTRAPLKLQKGDAVGSSLTSKQLAELRDIVLAKQNEPGHNYVFAGFWSAPSGYEPYEEQAHAATSDHSATPTCYYVLNDDNELMPAANTEDGWLTADNASASWLEDANTTLYAHWKYDLSFQVDTDDTIPVAGGASDMLLFGVADEAFSGATSDKVPFTSIDLDRDYVDVRGMITYGSPLTIPMDRASNTTEAISRIRNFNDPSASAYGFAGPGRTGYVFAGWTMTSGTDANDAELLTKDTPLTASTLKPAAGPDRGHVTLYAQWNALDYEITFEHYPQGMYGDYITDESVKAPNTKLTLTVPYDGKFADVAASIAPPALYGFDYLGYYSREGGLIDGDSVANAGVQFFTAPSADVGNPAIDGRSLATSAPWFAPVTSTSRTAMLYAYYARLAYNMHFEARDDADGTLQVIGGTEPDDQKWRYGDKLWEGSTAVGQNDTIDWEVLLPQSAGFSRHGYTFDGWYFLKDEPATFESDEARAAWHADKANRVYLYRVDNTNATDPVPLYGVWTYDGAAWVQHSDVLTWRTVAGLIDAEKPYTLYGSWTPKTYAVTFNTNYQNGLQNSEVTRAYVYEEVIGPSKGNVAMDPTSAGAPFSFLGWNEKTSPEADKWLVDKSDYADHPTQADRAYPHLMPNADGRFMPSTEASTIYLYAIWEDPGRKNIILFAGAHGTLNGGIDTKETAYKIIDHDFRYGWEIDAEGLNDRTNPISLSVADGYEHLGWVELSPADITGTSGTLSYDGLDRPTTELRAGIASEIANRVNDAAYQAKSTRFPEIAKVTDKTTGYVNPYTGEEGFTFRDIYLVAVYRIIGDYEIVLDLGAAADYADSEYSSLTARIDTATSPFTQRTMTPNIRYGYTFDVRDADFQVPDALSSMHTFQGWMLNGAQLTTHNKPDWLDDDLKTVKIAAYAEYAKRNPHATVLSAVWTPKAFTVVFRSDHGDQSLTENEDITLRDVGIGDKFTLPYPATRGEGSYFSCWRLLTTDTGDYMLTGRFNAGTEIDLRRLLHAVNSNLSYPDDSPSGSAVVNHVDTANDTITFDARWNQAISVEVPIEVNVKVDAANDIVLTADNLSLSTRYRNDAVGRSQVKVVSLRYDRLEAKPGQHVFGADLAGKAYLSVYADLVTQGDTSRLFEGANINDDGTLKTGAVGDQKKPLLIDLSKSAVFSERYPSTTGSGVYDGLYDDGHLDGEDPDHSLADHGFRAFSVDDRLPIRYGLLFRGIDDVLAAAPLLGELRSDTSDAFPIAKLYYTISLA